MCHKLIKQEKAPGSQAPPTRSQLPAVRAVDGGAGGRSGSVVSPPGGVMITAEPATAPFFGVFHTKSGAQTVKSQPLAGASRAHGCPPRTCPAAHGGGLRADARTHFFGRRRRKGTNEYRGERRFSGTQTWIKPVQRVEALCEPLDQQATVYPPRGEKQIWASVGQTCRRGSAAGFLQATSVANCDLLERSAAEHDLAPGLSWLSGPPN